MNTRKTVYNKLFKEETKLATHEIELGLIDDLSKFITKNETYKSNAIRINENVNSLFKILNGIIDEFDNMKIQLSNIPGASANIGASNQDITNLINKIEAQTKELGIDIKSIKSYTTAIETIKQNNVLIKDLQQSKKVAENILSQLN
jgi:hypothetical protein